MRCTKTFKLKGHLKNHENKCKGILDYIKFSDCENIFKCEKTLRQHKCKAEENYKCDECESSFASYSEFTDHRMNNHKNVVCNICGSEIHLKNIRRHMKTLHDGQTPSKYAFDHKHKHDKKINRYNCEECSKQFFDKSIGTKNATCTNVTNAKIVFNLEGI
jgi:DNA-directed RNA polymerase subunit RPC12/RpoP